MKTIFGIIFVLLLSFITLHDANSSDLLGYDTMTAQGINQPVVAVRTIPDGQLYGVSDNGKTASQLLNSGRIATDNGLALDPSEIGVFFVKGNAFRKGQTTKKVPGPGEGW